jgi:ribonuclease BN (tRNA processing enzyme)
MARKPRLRARPSTVPTTQIIMLGTGTPRPDPARSGPATGIVVNGTPYLVDSGPGVVRRIAAAYEKGITEFGFAAIALRTIFLTHLHADHTAGYPDLILTPWILGRGQPLEVYGPKGLRSMTGHVLQAWQIDIEDRLTGIDRLPRRGCRVNAHEIAPGVIYVDRNIRVTAFPVRHGDLAAFGFRFETPDRIIVISGDTAPTPNLVEHCEGCDVLIHEAYSERTYEGLSPKWQRYRRSHHTSSRQLAALATRVRPGLLVLYHRSNAGGGATRPPDTEEQLLCEIRRLYRGQVVAGHDLDIF